MVEIDTLFQIKAAKNHNLWRDTFLYSLYKGRHPPWAKNMLQIMSLAAYASETKKWHDNGCRSQYLKPNPPPWVAIIYDFVSLM